MKSKLHAAALAGIAIGLSASAAAQELRPELMLSTAQSIAAGCQAFARENDLNVTVAVIDRHGNLKLFQRMDGAGSATLQIAEMKARTSATIAMPSKAFGELTERVPGIALVPGMASWEGGEPIFTAEGAHLGGVGVSGASSAQDAACGRAGIDATDGVQNSR